MIKKLLGIYALSLLAVSNVVHAIPEIPQSVPEIDGAGAFTALGLLAGAIALFAEKKRQK